MHAGVCMSVFVSSVDVRGISRLGHSRCVFMPLVLPKRLCCLRLLAQQGKSLLHLMLRRLTCSSTCGWILCNTCTHSYTCAEFQSVSSWNIFLKRHSQDKQVDSCVNTSDDPSGHVISDVPGIIGCFGSFNIIHPHPGDLAGADQTPACGWLASYHDSMVLLS